MIYILLATILFIFYMLFEASQIKPEYLKIQEGKSEIRIAFLSDIHINLLLVSAERLRKIIFKASPDLLLIAGDLINTSADPERFMKWLKGLNLTIPVFVTLGNHDHKFFKKHPFLKDVFLFNLKSAGVKLMDNNCIPFTKDKKTLNLVGIDDCLSGSPEPDAAFRTCDDRCNFTVAFSHNPELALTLQKGKADLFLCGHFHGGQIWMPYNLEYRVLRNEKTCKAGYHKGFCHINGIPTYISRGLGNVLVPFRLGSRPEITFIDV